jgi:uncharacterized protein YbjT (DUF2867 family)
MAAGVTAISATPSPIGNIPNEEGRRMKVAVAGGTGLVGAFVVSQLTERGDEPVVLARSRGVDLVSGSGLETAVQGCDAIIDVSNVTTTKRAAAEEFFGTTTRHLQDAATAAGAGHLIALSIVGIDRVQLGYYLGKRRQEEVLAAGSVPWSVLRATQFHEFAEQMLARMPGPVAVIPRILSRPVAAKEVAAALIQLLDQGPQQHAPEIAGPEDIYVADMARRVLGRRGKRHPVLSFRIPGRLGSALAHGALLPHGPFTAGQETFEQYLRELPVA